MVGGIQIDEPAADLAVAAAIASSWKDIAVRADAVLIGEIGLAGELRMPGQIQTFLREAAKLGFKWAIVPKAIHQGEASPKKWNHRSTLYFTSSGYGICHSKRIAKRSEGLIILRPFLQFDFFFVYFSEGEFP